MSNHIKATALIFLITLAVYSYCLIPGAMWGDGADLALSCKFLIPAHSTGYPWYIMLGYLLGLLPFGDIAYRVGLLSAFFASIASALFFQLLCRETSWGITPWLGALLLAGNPIFWMQAIRQEVYTLNSLLLIILIYILRWGRYSPATWVLIGGFLYGLALSHHVSILLSFPFILYLYLRRRAMFFAYLLFFTAAVAGFCTHLFTIIRASSIECMSFRELDSLAAILRHISGIGFSGNVLGSTWDRGIMQGILDYLGIAVNNLTVFGVGCLLVGMIAMVKQRQWFYVILFVPYALAAMFYRVIDFYEFYTPSYIAGILIIAKGAEELAAKFSDHPSVKPAMIIGIILLMISLFSLMNYIDLWDAEKPVINYRWYDEPAISTRQALDELPPHSLLFVNWQYGMPVYYAMFVEHRGIIDCNNIVMLNDLHREKAIPIIEANYGEYKLYSMLEDLPVPDGFRIETNNPPYRIETR